MQTLTKITVEEYLANEAKADFKSEYHDGEVVAMAGAQLAHNQIVANLIIEIGVCLKAKNCQVLASNMLLKLPECNKYVYPDITIVCETIELDEAKQNGLDVLLNPTIIIEVLSESTSAYDQSEKMRCYFTLPSLQQYVLVDSEKIDLTTYTRTPENDWLLHLINQLEDKIKIDDCEIEVKDIYHKVEF
jgi:Uma2 family endonuclease